MKRNRRNSPDTYDRIYEYWPHLPEVHSLTAVPLKTIYYNRAADPDSVDLIYRSVDAVQAFESKYNVKLY